MPEYTYTFYDALSGARLGSLPLYGVSASDVLVGAHSSNTTAGAFTGSVRMDSDFVLNTKEILDITRPECTTVWMDRDGIPIWGGIVWTRTYQSDGRVMQLNAQGFASYLSRVVWNPTRGDLNGVQSHTLQENPYNIIRFLWEYLKSYASPEYNIVGVELEDYHSDGDAVLNPELWPSETFELAERKFLSEYMDNALKQDCEFRLRPMLLNGKRIVMFEGGMHHSIGVPMSGADDGGDSFQYPGDISKYWLTNSVSNAPTRLFAVGRTQGADDIATVIQGGVTNRLGVDNVETYETSSLTELTLQGNRTLAGNVEQLYRPVYELANESVNMSWGLGDHWRVIIDDPYRFETPVGGIVRLVSWQLSPASSDGVETQSITVDHPTALVPLDV